MLMVRRTAGKSMMPALKPGTIVIAWTRPRRIKPGDVIIFVHEGQEKIKRVQHADERGIYVIGDNPRLSTDSRDFGWVNHTAVVGRVWWPRLV